MTKNKYVAKTFLLLALAFTMLISACSNGGNNGANSGNDGAASEGEGGNASGALKPVELVMVFPAGGEPKDLTAGVGRNQQNDQGKNQCDGKAGSDRLWRMGSAKNADDVGERAGGFDRKRARNLQPGCG